MTLTLTEYKFIESDIDVTCEAGEHLWAYTLRNRDYKPSMGVVKAMIASVNTTIPKGEKHILLLFVDDEAEAVEVHCREFVNKIMVRYELYPPVILNAISDYKRNYKQ